MLSARRALFVFFLSAFPILVFAQSADQQIVSASDSPDPVVPGNNVTYTVQTQNNGPDPAVNGGININFPGMTWVSGTGPAGFSCAPFGNVASCTNPSWAPGPATFTIVLQMPPHLIGFADGSTNVTFSTSGVTPDPVGGNNNASVTTSWDSPQIDIALTASDSPDPVFPDGDITYTVNVVNNGPNTGTAAQVSMFNNNTLRFRSAVVPAGWNCTLPAVDGNPTFTCTKPSMASLETAQFTFVVRAYGAVLGLNDGSVSSVFSANATGDDTNDNNSQVQVDTAYVTPDADMQIVSATDSPDPVFPDGDITYTVTVTNGGPQAAPNAILNVPMNNTLRFVSVAQPVGWTCTPPAPGNGTSWSCTNPSFAVGASSVFTIVLRANDEQFGIFDQTIHQVFSVGSSVADPNNSNNLVDVTTQYTTADADMQITASDSPDPVAPDGDITYTVTVTNGGPDAAPNAILNVPMNNTLRFVSVVTPSGWTCTPPAVGGGTSWSCTRASFPTATPSVFTIVLRANDEQFGINDQTIHQVFAAGSSVADPNNANNIVDVATLYSTPDANVNITATDAPDPVVNGNNLTYTITAVNAGPDAAPNAQVTMSPHPSLTFQSLAAPAGWSCTTPAVNASGPVICTNASFASGASANFTLVTKLVIAGAGGTISSTFGVGSSVQDPLPANNSIEVFTNWIGQTADLTITKNTLATAAAQGSNITYTISTNNAGPDAATNVTVTDVLHASLRFQSITAPAGWTCVTPAVGANGTITCSIATLANGATASFTLVTSVAPNATGTIANTATVGATGSTDPNGGNSSGSSGVTAVAGTSDLGVTKTTGTTTIAPGGSITYTINVSNAGPDAAASVVMTDVLPAQLRFTSIVAPAGWSCTTPAVGANGTITCNAATLANGATATFTVNTTVATGTTGTITNTASATHSGTDGNAANNAGATPSITINSGTPNLAITKTTASTFARTGSTLAYTITVTNSGTASATNVVVTDALPAGLTFVSATPSQGTCSGTATVTCNLGTIATGANATIALQTTVAAASGTVSNTASYTATGTGGGSASAPPLPAGPGEEIPTLSEWMLIALAAALAMIAVVKFR